MNSISTTAFFFVFILISLFAAKSQQQQQSPEESRFLNQVFSGPDSAAVHKITPSNTNPIFLGQQPSFLFFFAHWCQSCKKVYPEIRRFANETQEYVRVGAIPGNRYDAFSKFLGVTSYPTMLYMPMGMKSSNTFTRYRGPLTAVALKKFALDQLLRPRVLRLKDFSASSSSTSSPSSPVSSVSNLRETLEFIIDKKSWQNMTLVLFTKDVASDDALLPIFSVVANAPYWKNKVSFVVAETQSESARTYQDEQRQQEVRNFVTHSLGVDMNDPAAFPSIHLLRRPRRASSNNNNNNNGNMKRKAKIISKNPMMLNSMAMMMQQQEDEEELQKQNSNKNNDNSQNEQEDENNINFDQIEHLPFSTLENQITVKNLGRFLFHNGARPTYKKYTPLLEVPSLRYGFENHSGVPFVCRDPPEFRNWFSLEELLTQFSNVTKHIHGMHLSGEGAHVSLAETIAQWKADRLENNFFDTESDCDVAIPEIFQEFDENYVVSPLITNNFGYSGLHYDVPEKGGGFMFLLHGKKNWQFVHPRHTFVMARETDIQPSDWASGKLLGGTSAEEAEAEKLFESDVESVEIGPRDAVYFPPGYLHRVWTEEKSLGVVGYINISSEAAQAVRALAMREATRAIDLAVAALMKK